MIVTQAKPGKSDLIEMFYNNKWGTICDNGWDINDTKVVCRQLGYNNASNAIKRAFFGEGTTHDQTIWFQDLECRGNEGSLFQCDHKGVGRHNCGHIYGCWSSLL